MGFAEEEAERACVGGEGGTSATSPTSYKTSAAPKREAPRAPHCGVHGAVCLRLPIAVAPGTFQAWPVPQGRLHHHPVAPGEEVAR
eukprot:CAMPEP_0172550774 /NCGR_PEP_ID=MMETSP1067-20121228/33178_1 /TAXON_ID=265564 ORGANISM="Thalassiosira punctigera, Strain Tpunct2005C2" /NCGR_SAMPLE_ID=MMETSP1067 /ASSEMBLY_ACC=CAM_ASM_000444 /LENGTH=85 /DNA_ID=CAMNT_0013338439 /DNA_START=27 /DNA_END=281 /DNA_ORIENTATION=+